MKVEILDRTKKKKIMEKSSDNYVIEDIGWLFIKTGKEKVRLFTGEIGWWEEKIKMNNRKFYKPECSIIIIYAYHCLPMDRQPFFNLNFNQRLL